MILPPRVTSLPGFSSLELVLAASLMAIEYQILVNDLVVTWFSPSSESSLEGIYPFQIYRILVEGLKGQVSSVGESVRDENMALHRKDRLDGLSPTKPSDTWQEHDSAVADVSIPSVPTCVDLPEPRIISVWNLCSENMDSRRTGPTKANVAGPNTYLLTFIFSVTKPPSKTARSIPGANHHGGATKT
ncbi:hypothetical protein L2E82_49843 [Cichorium intybus]|uniref:Uncharacterized protein n=1 Tax=Cichorium intybus TaxID=13427 RepID=A0ACB8Z1P5_CICIN|nr:hypothetical protein L2E82_49843 [Cichorium intybus]